MVTLAPRSYPDAMDTWYSRPIFFVNDVEKSLGFYVDQLGFNKDWTHVDQDEVIVAQVSRGDFELILNKDAARAGSGRIYFHLHPEQIGALREELSSRGLVTRDRHWGMPISEVHDPDRNELFFDRLSE
jgi:catechol 2,3-dioxygenase-like lactoylglutathione lyase family enzyme